MYCKIAFLITLLGLHPLSAVTLVSNEQAKASVILPDQALPVQKLAAEELIYHVRRATGAELQLYTESQAPKAENYVYIGPCRRTKAVGIEAEKLAPAEFRLLSRGNELFICGRDNDRGPVGSTFAGVWHGTLWGVYDLLRTELGIRWIWPGELGEIIPRRRDIVLPGIDRSRGPRLRVNYFHGVKLDKRLKSFAFPETPAFYEAQKRFLLRNRLGATERMNYGHNFTLYWQKYGKKHPEYFAESEPGKRTPLAEDTKGIRLDLCLTNPALHQRISGNYFAKKKPGELLNLCLNDTPVFCRCAQCRSWDEPDPAFEKNSYWNGSRRLTSTTRFSIAEAVWGEDAQTKGEAIPSLSDRYCRFVNAVLKIVRQKAPEVKAAGYAYANYTEPPRKEKVSGLILIHVGQLWFPYTEKMSARFQRQWRGWRNAGVTEFVYRPNLTHAGANLPIFYAREFAADFRYAAQNGMIGASLDSLLGAYAVQGPTLYTIIRLMDDPDNTVDRILDEYYSCFGAAKEEVRAYFEFWEKHSAKLKKYDVQKIGQEESINGRAGGTFKNYVLISHRLFSQKDFDDAGKFLKAALQKKECDPDTRRRVEYLQKGLHDAELTVKARNAQVKLQKEPGPENQRRFREAVQELYQFRVKIAPDFVANHAVFFHREILGAHWPDPRKKN